MYRNIFYFYTYIIRMTSVLNPTNGYKYNSKYSSLSPEEIMNEKRKKYMEWKANLSEDKLKRLKEQMARANEKKNVRGVCIYCGGKEYTDIYQHNKTRKHLNNLSNANKTSL